MSEYKSKLVCYYSKANDKCYWAMIVDEVGGNDGCLLTEWEIQDLEGKFHTRHWIGVPKYFIFPAHSWEKIIADPKLKQEYEATLMEQVNKDKFITITAEQRDAIKEMLEAYKSYENLHVERSTLAKCAAALSRLNDASEKMLELKCDEI